MRGRVVGAAVAVGVAAVAGAGWLVAEHEARVVLDQGVAQFRAQLGPDTRFSYASAVPSVLRRDARFAAVVLEGPRSTVTADTMVVACDAASVCSGTADGVKVAAKDAGAVSGTAAHVGWTRLDMAAAGGGAGLAEGALNGRLDAGEARGVHLGGGGGEVDVAAVSIADYGAGRRGRGTLDGLAVTAQDPSGGAAGPAAGVRPAFHVAVAHAAFDGVDVASAAGAVRSGVAASAAPGRQTLEVAGLDLSQGGAVLLHVGRLGSVTDVPAAGAVHGVGDVTDVRLDGPPALVESLRGLGYAGFAGEMHVDASLDRAAGALTIAALRVVGQGMGEATLAGGFSHLPQNTGATPPDPAAMLGLTVGGLDLALVDGGLVGRVIDAKARTSGVDPAVLRDGVARQVEALPVQSGPARSVRAALAAFVRAPGTLTLGVHPAAPVSLLEVAQLAGQGPDGVVGALGLTAVAAATK
ncbi:MAG: hypothetical protein ACRYG6_00870 [Janthinobacterium lividum]